jgi:hypothetical protein
MGEKAKKTHHVERERESKVKTPSNISGRGEEVRKRRKSKTLFDRKRERERWIPERKKERERTAP